MSHVADLDRCGLWIYLWELAPNTMVGSGDGLPASGEEEACEAALADEDRGWLGTRGR